MKRVLFLVVILFVFASCKHEEIPAKLNLTFNIAADGDQIQYDVLEYQNDAGNPYQVSEVKFFISAVQLFKEGKMTAITDNYGIHYYDSNLPDTRSWDIADELEEGAYDSIAFVFGLLPEQNVTGFFVNPPENNMSWPEVLGGGYHYMQINGKWLAAGDTLKPFNLHTGIGQTYANGEITGFIHNQFRVVLPLNGFQIRTGHYNCLTLEMNVNNWFRTPHRIDWNEIGGSIMQNQEVQQWLKENGANIFLVRR